MKKRIIIIPLVLFIAYALIVYFLFNSILHDPISKIAIPYLRNNTDLQKDYGEIIYIGKNVFYKTYEEDGTLRVPYSLETEKGNIVVYVTLLAIDGDWEPNSLEIIEVKTK